MIASKGLCVGSIGGSVEGDGPKEADDVLRVLRKDKRFGFFTPRKLPFHEDLSSVVDDPRGVPGLLRAIRGA